MTNINSSKLILGLIVLLIGYSSSAQSSVKTVTSTYTPSPSAHIVETLQADYSTFYHYIKASGLLSTLNNGADYTVFAPTNTAIANLPEATKQKLGQDKEALKAFVANHIYQGNYTLITLGETIQARKGKMRIKNINNRHSEVYLDNGKVVLISPQGKKITLNNHTNPQDDGVIYTLNSTLTPRSI